jgi:hypothetical protein
MHICQRILDRRLAHIINRTTKATIIEIAIGIHATVFGFILKTKRHMRTLKVVRIAAPWKNQHLGLFWLFDYFNLTYS